MGTGRKYSSVVENLQFKTKEVHLTDTKQDI